MKNITIHDSTLRDGNHAVKHQLSIESFRDYCIAAEKAGVPIVEVGHGNGLGASSLQVGLARHTDTEILETARKHLKNTKLAVHLMPGFATIKKNLEAAISIGVDVFRVGSHCTEADVTQRHIEFARSRDREVVGSLMMSHMVSPEVLLGEARKMQSYGALGVSLYDSAGAYLPHDVTEKISHLKKGLNIKVGFHAHNNLGLAVANSVAAVEAGAEIIDASILGFGAGAGNTQLEVLVAVFGKLGYQTGVNLYGILDAANLARQTFVKTPPVIYSESIVSGLAGVFSGFAKHVERVSKDFNLDPRDIIFRLGEMKVIGGQEDMIVKAAHELRGSL